jgi:hypothetical protein
MNWGKSIKLYSDVLEFLKKIQNLLERAIKVIKYIIPRIACSLKKLATQH